MIKKILLTSAALLSVTGAWAIDDNTITHAGVIYTKGEPSDPDITNRVCNRTTIITPASNAVSNAITITETVEYTGSQLTTIPVTISSFSGESVTVESWNSTLAATLGTNIELGGGDTYDTEEEVPQEYTNLANNLVSTGNGEYVWYSSLDIDAEISYAGNIFYKQEDGAPNTMIKENKKWIEYTLNYATYANCLYRKSTSNGVVYYLIESIREEKTVSGTVQNNVVYVPSTIDASSITDGVKSLIIGSCITSLTGTFANAKNLKTISNSSSCCYVEYVDEDVYVYNSAKNTLLYTSANNKTITLLPSATSIASGAINNRSNLIIKASGITSNPKLEGTNNILHKNEAIVNGNAVTGFINQTAFNSISFNLGQSYDFSDAVIEEDITVSSLPANTILFFTKKGGDTWNISGDNVVINTQCSNLVLTDGVAYNNTISEFTAATATYTRSLTAEKWGTLVIPFESQNNDVNITAAELTNVANNQLFFTKTGYIRANAPVMLYSTTTQEAAFTGSSVTVKMSAPTVGYTISNKTSQFVGTYSQLTIEEGGSFTYYGYYPSREQFLKMGNGKTVSAFRGCIKASTSDMNAAEAPAFRLIDEFSGAIEDITASVTDIDIVTTEEAANKVYSLDGKYAEEIEHSTIYVKNGKKFINK